MEVYLPFDTQEKIFLYFNIMCVVSTSLNFVALAFLIKETPPQQANIRRYLIGIQIMLIVCDFHLEIAFHPIPLFPVYAGYAVGFLVQLGVSTHLELAIVIILYIWMGASIMLCVLFRHQSIVPDESAFKFRKLTIQFLWIIKIFVFSLPGFVYAFSGNDAETVERYINEDPHNISWIRNRGKYYAEKRTPWLMLGYTWILTVLISGSSWVIFLFLHMFYVLRLNSERHSVQSKILIKRSLIALFIQLCIPFLLYIVPTVGIFMGLMIEDLITFETSLTLFLTLPWHSIGHNLILLTITSVYRKRIVAIFFKLLPFYKKPADPRVRHLIQRTI